MRDKIIRILWSDPMLVDDMIQSEESHQPGLYYITQKLHGKEKSLYIGKASRTVRERLIKHRNEWLSNRYGGKACTIGQNHISTKC